MRILLAEDIGGWLLGGMLLLGSLGASVLALGALRPAWRGMRTLTLCLIAPAAFMVVVSTGYLVSTYFKREFHDLDETMTNYVEPWLMFALPPLVTGLLSATLLFCRRRRQPD